MAKVTIIGAGQAGATTAHWLAERGIADLVLVDIREGVARGKALDLMQAMPVIGSDAELVGTGDYEETVGSDIVVITAGAARKPGMQREDLLTINSLIVETTVQESLQHSPDAVLIILTNPLDAMSLVALRASGLPRERVLGQAGILDSARMRCFVAMELGVSVENVHCYVLGGHGDSMVPLVRHSNVAGVPLVDILPTDRLEAIVERTRKAGGEIISLLGTGSAYYAPGAALAQMVEAVLLDRHRIVPASVYLQGEYGLSGICFGVPVQLGRGGMERILELDLNPEEQQALQASAAYVRETIEALPD
ncbi:MAG TPA: malate dehydrogenase [Anaerolineae bacterium]|nr:malate dehydrogenase [Anaerolineae bacterium]